MFKKNETHEQVEMFKLEDQFDERLHNMLKGNWSDIFYENIFMCIDESIFKPLYSNHIGRSNFPVNILAALEIIKELFTLTDEQLLERYHFDLLVRRSLGLEDINEHILAPRTLYYFRSAIVEYELTHGVNLLMQVFKDGRDKIIREIGLKTGLQRTDSTMIEANIKKMNRLMLFHKVLSNFVTDLVALKIHVSSEIQELIKNDEDNFSYRLKKEEVLLKTKEISDHLYSLFVKYKENSDINGLKSFKNAERLLKEQCNIVKDKLQLKEPKDIDSSSMQNPSDPDATYKKKRNKAYRGYAAHATETCDKDNVIQVITDVDLVKNNVDDAKVLSSKIEGLKEETDLETIITDATFTSDDVRKECKENEVDLVSSEIRGTPTRMQLENKLTSRDFDIDEATNEVKSCPKGLAPRSQNITAESTIAYFDPKICMECEDNNLCIAFFSSRSSRIEINDKRRWLDERHELFKTEGYRELCNLRPPVEGLMEKMKPKYLSGRTLFRGLEKVRNRMILKAIGLNFKRYKGYRGNLFPHFKKLLQIISERVFLSQKWSIEWSL